MTANFSSLLLLILTMTQCAKLSHNDLLTQEDQLQDYDILVSALTEACPILDTYHSMTEVEQHFASMREQINEPVSMLAFYQQVARTLSFFQDGHLQSYASNDFYASVNNVEGFLPMRLKFLDDKIYVWSNLSSSSAIVEGMEILSINAVKATNIIKELSSYLSSDGGNKSFIYHKLNNEYRLYLAFLFGLPTEYTVELKGIDKPVTLRAISAPALWDLAKKKPEPSTKKELFSITYDADRSIVIFQFTTFGDREGEGKLREILEDLVTQCKQKAIKHLILDIRGNTGGFDGNAAIVYSYLTNAPFQSLNGRYLKTNQLSFLEYVLNKDIQKTLQSVPMVEHKNGFKVNMALDQVFQPNQLNYTGNVYLLTDHSTFSSAGLFTSIFYNNKRGKIIGTPTGGGYRGDSGGVFYLELPNSKINVFIPLVKNDYICIDSHDWVTFVPHITIQPTIDDLLTGRDPVLDVVYQIVENAAVE